MCKFCDSRKHTLLVYNNYDDLDEYMGQSYGISIYTYTTISMKGNMLLLEGDGRYNSESDIYYEANGLEIDDKFSNNSLPTTIKISFCPFCGKKLDNGSYEVENAKRQIKLIKNNIAYLSNIINHYWNIGTLTLTRKNAGISNEKINIKDTDILKYVFNLNNDIDDIFSEYNDNTLIDYVHGNIPNYNIKNISNTKFSSKNTYVSSDNTIMFKKVYRFKDDDILDIIRQGNAYVMVPGNYYFEYQNISEDYFNKYIKVREKVKAKLQELETKKKEYEEIINKYKKP